MLFVVSMPISFAQTGVDILNSLKEQIADDKVNWKTHLITAGNELETDEIKLKIEILRLAERAEKASTSNIQCVAEGFIEQIDLELDFLIDWVGSGQVSEPIFPMKLCDIEPSKYDLNFLETSEFSLRGFGFNINEDLTVKLSDERNGRNQSIPKKNINIYENEFKISVSKNTLNSFAYKENEQNAGFDYALSMRSKSGNFKDYILLKPRTYTNEEAQKRLIEQSKAEEERKWKCGNWYYVNLQPKERWFPVKLEERIRGDGNFGGDVDFDITYGIEISADQKKMYAVLEYTATECCSCHNEICFDKQKNSDLGRNNSKWKSKQEKILLFEAPENFSFRAEYLYHDLTPKKLIVERRRQGRVVPISADPGFKFIRYFQVFGSDDRDEDILNMKVEMAFSEMNVLMIRTENCGESDVIIQ